MPRRWPRWGCTTGRTLFLLASALGCISADALLVWIVGLHTVRKLYARAAPWITRGVAFLFFGFAAYSVIHIT